MCHYLFSVLRTWDTSVCSSAKEGTAVHEPPQARPSEFPLIGPLEV